MATQKQRAAARNNIKKAAKRRNESRPSSICRRKRDQRSVNKPPKPDNHEAESRGDKQETCPAILTHRKASEAFTS